MLTKQVGQHPHEDGYRHALLHGDEEGHEEADETQQVHLLPHHCLVLQVLCGGETTADRIEVTGTITTNRLLA